MLGLFALALAAVGGASALSARDDNSTDFSDFKLDNRLHRSFWGMAYTPQNSSNYPTCGDTIEEVARDMQLLSQRQSPFITSLHPNLTKLFRRLQSLLVSGPTVPTVNRPTSFWTLLSGQRRTQKPWKLDRINRLTTPIATCTFTLESTCEFSLDPTSPGYLLYCNS